MERNPENPSSLPLTETTFLILLSLSTGPRHGYAILKDVQALSNGRVILTTGTLYGAIKRLVEQGWIERFDGPVPDPSGRERKEYQLTRLGKHIFDAECSRLDSLVSAMRLRASRGQP
jgi:DNA-binding PadR family transcriptional regulator